MKRFHLVIGLSAAACLGWDGTLPAWGDPVAMKVPAPEFAGIDEWINGKPLQLKDLRGQVVVVHFWAFG